MGREGRGGGSIDTHFGSEVGITSANADPGGGQSTLTLKVKLGLALSMLILGGVDRHSLWK